LQDQQLLVFRQACWFGKSAVFTVGPCVRSGTSKQSKPYPYLISVITVKIIMAFRWGFALA